MWPRGHGSRTGWKTPGMTPEETVDEFIRRVVAVDLDGAAELVSADLEYANVPIGWLSQPELILPSLFLWGFPWIGAVGVLIFLAGLQSIGQDVYEAAELDGVGPIGKFIYIELPLILTQVRLMLVLLIVGTSALLGAAMEGVNGVYDYSLQSKHIDLMVATHSLHNTEKSLFAIRTDRK